MGNEGVMDPVEGGTVDHGRRRFLTATTAVVGAAGVGVAAVVFGIGVLRYLLLKGMKRKGA